MTEAQLIKRVAKWQRRLHALGVSHWRLDDLEIVDSEGTFLASVRAHPLYDRFKLRFDSEYLREASPKELDETIVHELVHVAMRDFDEVVSRAVNYAPGGEDGDLSESATGTRENLVHRLSVALTDSYRK